MMRLFVKPAFESRKLLLGNPLMRERPVLVATLISTGLIFCAQSRNSFWHGITAMPAVVSCVTAALKIVWLFLSWVFQQLSELAMPASISLKKIEFLESESKQFIFA
eukprot:TRINITY_DN34033_c0_g1_i1.p1 TRINITY_DN34033_c0_g1~~TRINITY_DN34033_c0_g1_i1.p1  ORF type:complete len:107 (-),score=17.92 TRINITY_DN34033_c0_g1_i1:470-790(-)